MKMILRILIIFALSTLKNIHSHDIKEYRTVIGDEFKVLDKEHIHKRDVGYKRMLSGNYRDFQLCKMCGVSSYHTELWGEKVKPTQRYPWMVALQLQRRKFCAGTIISDQYILTAAHCLIKNETVEEELGKYKPFNSSNFLKPEDITLAFLTNTHFLQVDDAKVQEVIPHPNFNFESLDHDIGLLKLENKLMCSKLRNPVCLPTSDIHIIKEENFITTGWNIEGSDIIDPEKPLKEFQVKYVDFNNCANNFSMNLQSQYYCVLNTGSGNDCYSDSGSPMFHIHKEKYYVAGVASVSSGYLCKNDYAFIYTSVQAHMDWINKALGYPVAKQMHLSGFKRNCLRK